MGFIDSYKRLEKLCGEVMGDDRRVSAYIDAMQSISNGGYYVSSWDADLKMLKHCRYLRNKIVHEPDCTEKNMCKPEDELFVKRFYKRMLNKTDPLALYRKANRRTKKRAARAWLIAIFIIAVILILISRFK